MAHPHLVAILADHVNEPPYFVVMPRLAGHTLAALLGRAPTLSVSRAMWIARQAAEALDALHRHGLLHGDVKPANLQLAPTGHATLLDLSFARPMNDGSSLVDLPLLGTLNYLPPEQIAFNLAPRSAQRHLQPRHPALRNACRRAAVRSRRSGRTIADASPRPAEAFAACGPRFLRHWRIWFAR